jgi:arylsulfatase A-like enzyme
LRDTGVRRVRSSGSRPRRAWLLAALLVTSLSSVVVITLRVASPSGGAVRPAVTPSRPNILLLVSDDQAHSTFNRTIMPNVFSKLVDQGVLFDNAYVHTSLCCPSRAQMFTGLYATNTDVSTNFDPLMRPTVIEAMHDSGYRTLLAGKYLNSHPCQDVRPEFDEYYCYGGGTSSEKNPTINVNGTDTPFTGYSADILANFVTKFISTTPTDQPFLAMYTAKDPHMPADDDRFNNIPVPSYRPPNYDEDTLHDNKPVASQRGPLTAREIAEIDKGYADMYRSTRGLDDAVGTILDSLGSRADNTVVIYMSDNGFFYGEHRKVLGKIAPYQESVNVPMVVRDPMLHSTANPVESHALVENVDVGATLADRAGIEWHTDGKSLTPLLDGSASSTRDAALLEHCVAGAGPQCWPPGTHQPLIFVGVVTDRYKYIEYDTGEKELYDLAADPYELANHAGDPAWATTQAQLASQLAQLRASPPVDTTIVTGPRGVVGPGTQQFTYFSPPPAATYSCRLSTAGDPGSWLPCGSQSTTVGPLGPGTYTFAVEGTVGTDTDATPAVRTFTVDGALPVISVGDVSVNEGAAAAARKLFFTISLSHPATRSVKVSYRTDDGTAQSGSGHDFTPTWGTATVLANHTTKVVPVPVGADRTHEADETVHFRLRNPVGGVLGAAGATGTIIDDDPAPKLSVGSVSVIEGTGDGGVAVFPLQLSAASGLPVTVHADTQPGKARLGVDYYTTHAQVTFSPGVTQTTVSVPIVGDSLSENDEKFSLVLSNAQGAQLRTASADATIIDDDPLPALSIADASIVEGDSGQQTIAVPVTLSAKAGRPVKVAYTTVDGSAHAPGDYLSTSGTLTIAAGSVGASISIAVIGDHTVEGDEQFDVVLSAPQHATIAAPTSTVTVYDNESPPGISVADTSVTEGDTGSVAAHFVVSLSVPSTHTVTVDYATADGTATAPDDYTAVADTITFAPGETQATVDVPVIGDTVLETDETFTLGLSNPTNGTLATATATGTILDDDSRPVVTVGNSPAVTEGDSGTTDAVFTVALDATTTRDVSVDYATADGTASAPDDYLATSGTVTIPAGETTANITVPVVGDTRYELAESFSIVIANPVNATLGPDTATAKIADDDAPPTITIGNNVVVTEGDNGTTDAVFTAQLSAASGLTTTADYQTSDSTASAPADYLATSGTVTFDPGATTATISVPVVGDTVYEGDERFLVVLTGATNGSVSDDDYGAYGIIENDDPAPVVSVADPSVAEGDSGTTDATFTVSITAATGLDTSIAYTTNDGTATAPDDYEATSGVATIPAGSTSTTITVAVVGDTIFEGDETFSLTISAPMNATLGTSTADATIIDDDPAPSRALRIS